MKNESSKELPSVLEVLYGNRQDYKVTGSEPSDWLKDYYQELREIEERSSGR